MGKPKQVQATREILRLQREQGFETQLAKRACSNLAFVPQHKETQERDIELLQESRPRAVSQTTGPRVLDCMPQAVRGQSSTKLSLRVSKLDRAIGQGGTENFHG